LFLIANRFSEIKISTTFSFPPFKNVIFNNSKANISFQYINNLTYKADSTLTESSAAKRLLIKKKLEKDLLSIADTSDVMLVSLYAIYKSNFKTNYSSNVAFYNAYFKKWKHEDNAYLESLKKQIPARTMNNIVLLLIILLVLMISSIVYILWKHGFYKKKKLKKLSIQERRIFELLRQGATNQEISNQYCIGISTVKSHVSSIYSKLNIKSRKEIMNLKL